MPLEPRYGAERAFAMFKLPRRSLKSVKLKLLCRVF